MDTGSQTTAPYHASVVGGEDEPTYRTVSIVAILALVLGLLSPLALVAPLLLAFPFFAVGVALVALRQIAANETTMVGRGAAVVGLALAVASVGAMFARSTVSAQILSSQARTIGSEWFARLQQGDAAGAFKMTQDSLRAAAPPAHDPHEGHDHGPALSAFDQFRANPIVEYLTSHGDHAAVKYDADVLPGEGPLTSYRIVQQYLIDDSHHGGKPIPVLLTLQRSRVAGQTQWVVMSYLSDELRPSDDHADHVH